MVFTKFVEVGRVALVNFGPNAGKLVVIVDIVNVNKVLIDSPQHNVRRQEISLTRLSLTEFKLDIKRAIRSGALRKAIDDFGLDKKWGETSWAKKLQKRSRRAALTDFERFKVKVLRQRKRVASNNALKVKSTKK